MKKAIIGAGGFAREVKAQIGDNTIKCFVDDQYYKQNDEHVYPLSEFDPTEYEVVVAIGDRQQATARAERDRTADTRKTCTRS